MPMWRAEVQALLCRHGDCRCISTLGLLLDTSRAQLTACNRVIKQKYSAARGAYQLLNGLEDAIENLRESKSPHNGRGNEGKAIQGQPRGTFSGEFLVGNQKKSLSRKRSASALSLYCKFV